MREEKVHRGGGGQLQQQRTTCQGGGVQEQQGAECAEGPERGAALLQRPEILCHTRLQLPHILNGALNSGLSLHSATISNCSTLNFKRCFEDTLNLPAVVHSDVLRGNYQSNDSQSMRLSLRLCAWCQCKVRRLVLRGWAREHLGQLKLAGSGDGPDEGGVAHVERQHAACHALHESRRETGHVWRWQGAELGKEFHPVHERSVSVSVNEMRRPLQVSELESRALRLVWDLFALEAARGSYIEWVLKI